MNEEPTEQDVEALARMLRTGTPWATPRELAHAILASDWCAKARREAAAEALSQAADDGDVLPYLVRKWLRDRAAILRGATP